MELTETLHEDLGFTFEIEGLNMVQDAQEEYYNADEGSCATFGAHMRPSAPIGAPAGTPAGAGDPITIDSGSEEDEDDDEEEGNEVAASPSQRAQNADEGDDDSEATVEIIGRLAKSLAPGSSAAVTPSPASEEAARDV